mgnify:CR=1 FL=1
MKSKQWHNRKSKDIYIKKAAKMGFVSRSAFKIIEIEKKFKLIKSSNAIIELGSSPGGWTQVIIDLKKNYNYKFICVDKNDLEINLNNNFLFIKEDFKNTEEIALKIKNYYNKNFNLILSDMSPNTIGHSQTDHLRIIQLAEEVFDFSIHFLAEHGNMVLKIFQGSSELDLLKKLKEKFLSIKYFKPNSSRKDSAEIYLICLDYKIK